MRKADPHQRGLLRRFYASFVRPYLGLQIEILACLVVGVLLGLVDPLILRAIIDTHLTVMVTAAILYNFGTGPVKGFAVSLFVGLSGSLFTAYFFTRLIFDVVWMGRRKVQAISI